MYSVLTDNVKNITISLPREPGGRLRVDGPNSGEEYSEKIIAALEKAGVVFIDASDCLYFPYDFIDGLLGIPLRTKKIDLQKAKEKISFIYSEKRNFGMISIKLFQQAEEFLKNKNLADLKVYEELDEGKLSFALEESSGQWGILTLKDSYNTEIALYTSLYTLQSLILQAHELRTNLTDDEKYAIWQLRQAHANLD